MSDIVVIPPTYLAHRAPVLFSFKSYQPISCRNIAWKASFLILLVRFSPEIENIRPYKQLMALKSQVSNINIGFIRPSTHLDELSEERIKSETNKHQGVLDCVSPSFFRIFITENTEGVSEDNSEEWHHRTLQ